jgi:2-polyprenyl-6-methoxyphenol hydroxylase-like FAD-dependent oxidoreductase
LAIARHGFGVTVFDQAPRLEEIGAGIQLSHVQLEAAGVHIAARRRGGGVAARGAFAGAIRSTPRCQNG